MRSIFLNYINIFLFMPLCSDGIQVTGSDQANYNLSLMDRGKDDFTKMVVSITGLEERMCIVWEKGVVC